ncbi:MAG: hypothetical protein LBG26_08420, partial [Treponema sp.]|nr:hypothetical protein [Treponema sp.]
METTQTVEEKPDFDKVWAAIQATNEQLKETDRIVKENAIQLKETDKQIKETYKQMKETDKRVGEITNRFGEMVEYMVVPNLVAKFREL